MFLYVTVSDGKLTAKNEVWVNIVNSSASATGGSGPNFPDKRQPFSTNQGSVLRPPSFLNLPSVFNHPPSSISNNPPPLPPQIASRPPIFQQKTYPDFNTAKPSKDLTDSLDPIHTHLLPVNISANSANPSIGKPSTAYSSTLPPIGEEGDGFEDNSILSNHSPLPADSPVKSLTDLTVTVVPAVSVLAIFLAVAVIALVFRKKICMGRVKGTKDDIVSIF